MINIDDYVNESKTEHNKNWSYRILIIEGSGSEKIILVIKFNRKSTRH